MTDELLAEISGKLTDLNTSINNVWLALQLIENIALWGAGFAAGWRLWSISLSYCGISIRWPKL